MGKKNKKYIIRKNKIIDKYVDKPLDKYVATPLGFIFKAIFIITGVIFLIYILSGAACFLRDQVVRGLSKVSVYDCAGSADSLTISASAICPLHK